jgi:hypothetical protein
MKAKLLKRMTVAGKSYNAGEVVDVSGWRNIRTLMSSRYLEIILEDDTPKVAPKVEVKAEPKVESKAKEEVTTKV